MFVTFEGVDGSGKSTQVELLARHLRERGRAVVTTREPGGTELGEQVRRVLLHGPSPTPWAEAALFAAARAELAERVIRPALARGADVLCDRFLDSSLAYQGFARGLGLDQVLELNVAVADLVPDLTFVLEVPPEVAARRVGRGDPDRIEQEGGAFSALVVAGYRELAERFPGRVLLVEGSGRPDEVAAAVRAELERVARVR
jgi:dTMP kinase